MLTWLTDTDIRPVLNQLRDIPMARLVREEILATILRGELVPGQRISDSEIAKTLSVSRMPVREALRDLEIAGLVETRKHLGALVRTLKPKEVADLYELRATLDAMAGRKVTEAPSPGLIDGLDEQLRRMYDASERSDTATYYQANLQFHWEIVSATNNNELIEIYRNIVRRLHVARLKSLSTDTAMMSSLRDHDAIVETIRRGDTVGCANLMSHHVQKAAERLAKRANDSATDVSIPLNLRPCWRDS